MDYEKELQIREEIEKLNQKYLAAFELKLEASGLRQKTIYRHLTNLDFFGNHFVLGYYEDSLDQSIQHIDEFMGDWFIRKAMWSNEASIKNNCASLNRFYKFLSEEKIIPLESYQYVKDLIKNHKASWIQSVNDYNSSSDFWY